MTNIYQITNEITHIMTETELSVMRYDLFSAGAIMGFILGIAAVWVISILLNI